MELWLRPVRQSVDSGTARLERSALGLTEGKRARLAGLAGRLEALSPLATLSRGYSVAHTADGQLIRSMEDAPAQLRFRLRLSDGTINAESLGPADEDTA